MFRQSLGFLPGSETRGKELLWNPHFQEQVCVCVCMCVYVCACSVVSTSVTPWRVAHQVPLSREFPR